MEKAEIIKKLEEIFCNVLDLDEVTLSDETTAEDIEEWDSLNHVHLIVAVEKSFSIKFSSSEIRGLDNVGSLIELIIQKSK